MSAPGPLTPAASAATPAGQPDCPLCREDGGLLIHRRALWRVVRVTDTPAHPVFYRLIWNTHVAEFTDLPPGQRHAAMDGVALIETVLRRESGADKINLASLGNVVPHLHWHVVARYADDPHFPAPIWAAPVRAAGASAIAGQERLAGVDDALRAALGAFP